jgi:hypothetical protein
MTPIKQWGSVQPEGVIDADAFNAFEAAGQNHQAPTHHHFYGRITSRRGDPLLDAAYVGLDEERG